MTTAKPPPSDGSLDAKRHQRELDLALLRARFPVFAEAKPLAIGIHKALRDALPEMNAERLKVAVAWHVRSSRYLSTLQRGGDRFDLAGMPQGTITAEQQALAKQELVRRNRATVERKRQQAQEQANQQKYQQKLTALVAKFSGTETMPNVKESAPR